jgi:6-phospho-beta-glucosidase
MLHKTLKPFPDYFLWGASTSAYQVEGASLEDGKGPSCQDVKELPAGTADLTVSVDHYHHYKEDISLMAEMGFKSYRFSISWSRVLPNGTGKVNPKGIEFYNNLIDECLKYGIEPIVTMFHFDMPAALDERGSWSTHESVDWFAEYARVLFENFGDRVKYWLTINEQNMLTLVGPVIGTLHVPEGTTNLTKEIYQQNHHQLVAQAKAMQLCHEMLPEAKIGPAPNISLVYAASSKPEDVLAAQNFNAIRNWLYLDAYILGEYNNLVWAYLEEQDATPVITDEDRAIMKAAKPDFIGFNYYNTATVAASDGTESLNPSADQQTARGEAGFYKLEETKTPDGYNTIKPIEFTIDAKYDVESADPQLTELSTNVTSGDVKSDDFKSNLSDGSLTAGIVNRKGSLLPSTGGMGTTILYVVGSILVLVAAILLITKKRMDAAK